MSEHPHDSADPRPRRLGRLAAGLAVVVGFGVLTAAPLAAQLGEPVGPGSTTTTSTSTTTTTTEPPTTTAADDGPTTTAPADDGPDEPTRAATVDDDDDGGTSIVALAAVGIVGLLLGLALAGLPLLAALSRRKAAAPVPGPPPAPQPAPPTPPVGGPAIGTPPARDADHVRHQRVLLVEAMIALRDKLPSEALSTEVADALAAAGISEVRPEGQRFDPAQHRAVHQVATDDPDRQGLIASVERVGYADGTTIIRQPEVVVTVLGSPS